MSNSTYTTSSTAFESAINSFKQTISPSDAAIFQSTSIEDVWKAAEKIQGDQKQRKSLRNMRRIEPFLKGLEKYSEVIAVLCNGTPYLPWIWAPIKLMLQLADEYTNVFDKLLDAYKQIGEAMPQFDRLESAFHDDENFRAVLEMVYSDILEFHRRAYKFFRRRSWHIFFDSLWKSFEFRFQGILKRLSHHQELLIREAVTIDIVAARQWRIQAQEDLIQQEKKSQGFYLHDSIAWLKVAAEEHDDELERLSDKRQKGTCQWVFNNPLFKTWTDDSHAEPILWVKGIPGAGKTILSAYVINRLHEETGFTTAYHICNSYTTGRNLLGDILRSVTVQLLRANSELAPHIFDNYTNKGLGPSIVRLRRLLPELLATITSIRIIIDGLDEYPEPDQRTILAEMIALSKSSGGQFRVLFSNREGAQINKILNGKPTISLRDESADVDKDIEAYVQASLEDFRPKFGDRLIDRIERRIVRKADGMFLWVRLVIQSLEECHSVRELEDAVDTLPEGLDQAYGRILHRVMKELNAQSSEKAIRILQWVACSFRILKAHEVQDGVLFHTSDMVLDESTKLVDGFLDLCKPLIEDGPKNTVDFVHYSAKEYILHETSGDNGAFLHYPQAHYNIAFSCMNYLRSSFCFINPAHSQAQLQVRVLKGFHGLHHYANEFWFQHLLQYAKCEDPVEDDQIDEFLDELEEFWKESPGTTARELKLDDTTSVDNIERQLDVFDTMPQARRMGLDILTFRRFITQEKYSHQDPERIKEEEIRHDPTHFSQISQHYQSIVRWLISSSADDLPQDVQPHHLERFKRIYTDSAFICRYRECSRYSDGFQSSTDRDKHESQHAKPLRCADPTCDFFARGFASKTGLLKHNRKYHPLPDEVELPAFEPRKEPELQYVPPPPPPPPPPRVETPPPLASESEENEHRSPPPKRTRVSRARKGLPVHNCDLCAKVYRRAEGLRRHRVTHYAPQFHCGWDNCTRAFYRLDLLERHRARHENMAGIEGNSDRHGSDKPESEGVSLSNFVAAHLPDHAPSSISVQSLLTSGSSGISQNSMASLSFPPSSPPYFTNQ